MTDREVAHMSRRTEIIISALIGPLLLGLSYGVWGASVRTRDNESKIETSAKTATTYEGRVMRRFGDLEARIQTVESRHEDLALIEEKQESTDAMMAVVIGENREEHREIKQAMHDGRVEFLVALKDMKTDLIREFRKNGNAH